jgi:hypothetical protein
VVVISHHFAQLRGLDIGDTITINIPYSQQIIYTNWINIIASNNPEADRFTDAFIEMFIHGNPSTGYIIQNLELEIVGTFLLMPEIPVRSLARLDNTIYIPDSLLPADFMAVDNYHGLGNERNWWDVEPFVPKYAAVEDYIWDFWYSFTLADSRNENAFILENREALAALGMNVVLLPSGAENFWLSAEPILQTATFNAIMFCVVLILVLSLITYLFLLQRRKDFAILRALGNPAKKAARGLCYAMIIFQLPAIALGSFAGWFIAINGAASTMNPLADAGFDFGLNFDVRILLIQSVIIFALMLFMAYMSTMKTAKSPVSELLQGRKANKTKRR